MVSGGDVAGDADRLDDGQVAGHRNDPFGSRFDGRGLVTRDVEEAAGILADRFVLVEAEAYDLGAVPVRALGSAYAQPTPHPADDGYAVVVACSGADSARTSARTLTQLVMVSWTVSRNVSRAREIGHAQQHLKARKRAKDAFQIAQLQTS